MKIHKRNIQCQKSTEVAEEILHYYTSTSSTTTPSVLSIVR